ncbi:hypothetical protein [Nostoc sp.]|uniref:hypothetical protein n=1 Tax=Nostoc sp. TaxID=1180 RepID=UPI002FF7F5C2
MDDFALLGLGNSTSFITNVQVALWGKEVFIDCVYDPDEVCLIVLFFPIAKKLNGICFFPKMPVTQKQIYSISY